MAYPYYTGIGNNYGYNTPDFRPQPMPQMPQMQQPAMQPQMPKNKETNALWVSGIEGAKAYLVAPNNVLWLMDSENPLIYIKSTDDMGMPSMRVLEYKERPINTPNLPVTPQTETAPAPAADPTKYATLEALEALQQDFETLSAKFDELMK